MGRFIFVDQFGPAHFDIGKGLDVRPHPHINWAKADWKAGEFSLLPGDDEEFIPIPEVPLTLRD